MLRVTAFSRVQELEGSPHHSLVEGMNEERKRHEEISVRSGSFLRARGATSRRVERSDDAGGVAAPVRATGRGYQPPEYRLFELAPNAQAGSRPLLHLLRLTPKVRLAQTVAVGVRAQAARVALRRTKISASDPPSYVLAHENSGDVIRQSSSGIVGQHTPLPAHECRIPYGR